MYELTYTDFGTARKEADGYWMIISPGEYYGKKLQELLESRETQTTITEKEVK